MNLILILGLVFALSMIVYTIFAFYKRQIMVPGLLLWMSIWIALVVFLIWPSYISILGDFFGVERSIDVLVYVSILALFYMTYKNYQLSLKQNSDITKIVREISKKK